MDAPASIDRSASESSRARKSEGTSGGFGWVNVDSTLTSQTQDGQTASNRKTTLNQDQELIDPDPNIGPLSLIYFPSQADTMGPVCDLREDRFLSFELFWGDQTTHLLQLIIVFVIREF